MKIHTHTGTIARSVCSVIEERKKNIKNNKKKIITARRYRRVKKDLKKK